MKFFFQASSLSSLSLLTWALVLQQWATRCEAQMEMESPSPSPTMSAQPSLSTSPTSAPQTVQGSECVAIMAPCNLVGTPCCGSDTGDSYCQLMPDAPLGFGGFCYRHANPKDKPSFKKGGNLKDPSEVDCNPELSRCNRRTLRDNNEQKPGGLRGPSASRGSGEDHSD
ncbi:hypothetical protein ACA910_006795 [Epithemia clementina (nom. ined.)]